MRTPPRAALAAAVLLLAGCASVDPDAALRATEAGLPSFTPGRLEIARTAAQDERRARLADELLRGPLGQDAAVQLALVNSPALQAALAQGWAELGRAAQLGRPANPLFSFERIRDGGELEIGRLLSFGLLDLLTLPQRAAMAGSQSQQAQVRLAAAVVDQVGQVRQAWVRAVAARQLQAYAQQVQRSAEASAELARRMQATGNFNRLQRARQQALYADAAAQVAASGHAATAAREALVRELGLTDAQAERLVLPERLPDVPARPREAGALTAAALEQRLDVRLARAQLDAAGRAQGLDLLPSLVDVELGARRDTRFHADGGRSSPRGWEAELRLPLFDWGDARRATLGAQALAAAQRHDAVARAAGSQLREGYSAYRTAHDLARHYRDEVVPLRKAISDENLLRYNGMLIGVFELLADHREQVAAVMAALQAQQQFWLADAALSSALVGRPIDAAQPPASAAAPASAGAAAH